MKAFFLKKYFFLFSPFLFSPLYLIKIPINSKGSINLLDFLLTIIIFYWFYKTSKKSIGNFISKNQSYLFFILLLNLGLVLSFFINQPSLLFFRSLGQLKSFFILPSLYAIIIAFEVNQNKKLIYLIKINITFLGSIIGFLGYLFFISNKLSYDLRLSVFYESPNYLGFILITSLFSTLSLLSEIKNKKAIFFLLTSLVAQLFSFFQSQSLSAFIGFFTAIIFLFFYSKNRKMLSKLPFLITISSTFFLFFFFTSFINFLYTRDFSKPPTSFDSRVVIYKSSKKIINKNLIFGVGIANFQETYLKYQKYFEPYPQWAVPHPHNLSLYLWTSGGLISLYSYLFLLKQKTTCKDKWLMLILLAIIIQNIFDTTAIKNDNSLIFFTILSILKTKA